jgi:RHS repeat-associated protein
VLADGTAYRFDEKGRLVDLSNAAGQRLDLLYDALGELERIVEPVTGVGLHLSYGPTGLLTRVGDDLGRWVDLSYDGRSRLQAVPAPSLPGSETLGAAFLPRPIPPAADGTRLVLEFAFLETEGVVGTVGFDSLVLAHDAPDTLLLSLMAPSGKRVPLPSGRIEAGRYVLSGWNTAEAFEGELMRGTWSLEIQSGPGAAGGVVEAATLSLKNSPRTLFLVYQDGAFPAGGRILGATDSRHATVFSCTYDDRGRVLSQDDGRPETPPTTLTYDPPDAQGHSLVTHTSRLGYRTRLEANAAFQVVSVENALGHHVRHEYDARGNRVATTDARGHRVGFTYDELNRLVSYTDEAGHRTDFQYATDQRWVSSISDSAKAGASFTYANASLTAAVGADGGGRLRMEYHPDRQLKRIVLNEYAKVDYTLDARGRIGTIGQPGAAGGATDNTGASKVYDLAGRVLRTRDYDGRTTNYEFTPSSEVARVIDPEGNASIFDYDHRGRLIRSTDARGRSTRHAYDGNGNVVSTTDAAGGISTFEYDADDRLVASSDALGRVTRYRYDATGQLLETIDPVGRITRLEYDPSGNVQARYRPDGRLDAAMEYDARGLVTRVRDAFGNTVLAEYDALGRKVRSTDATGYVRQFTYDPSGRLQFTQDTLKRRAFAAYNNDKGGVPAAVEVPAYPYDHPNPPRPDETEGEGLFLLYDYDYAGNLTEQDDGQVTYAYNRNNELETIYVGEVVALNLDYDATGRLASSKPLLPQFSTFPDERDRQYVYDATGQLVEVRASPAGKDQYQSASRRFYDDLGRLHRYIDERGDIQSLEYDAVGNLTARVYPDGSRVSYEYDDADRLIRVTDWAGRVTRYRWNQRDQVTRLELPNGVLRDLTYNALGQLVVRTDRNAGGAILISYQYQYDPEGRIESEIVEPAEPPPASASTDYRYSYEWNRLQSMDGLYGSDFAGNITRAPDLGDLRYNRRGRLYSTDRYRYHYDQEDRLLGWSSVENPARRTELTVAPVGRLPHVIAMTESDGVRTTRRRYVYGLGLLYEEVDGEPLYHHQDYRGSVVALSDSRGTVVGRLSYDPYGTVASRQGRTDTLFQFTGLFGCITSPDGIVYQRFRWYSPRARQFLQRDAFVGNISDFSRLNYFAYAGGDPISRVDPDGEFWWVLAGAAVGAAINVTATFVADLADDGRVNTSGSRYGAAAAGGAVTGTVFALTGGLGGAVFGGAAGAAAENLVFAALTRQKVDAGGRGRRRRHRRCGWCARIRGRKSRFANRWTGIFEIRESICIQHGEGPHHPVVPSRQGKPPPGCLRYESDRSSIGNEDSGAGGPPGHPSVRREDLRGSGFG